MLKCCPFCGNKVELVDTIIDGVEYYEIICINCNMGGSDTLYTNKERLIKDYNTRM
jgi:Lar family restriction alleviation protein